MTLLSTLVRMPIDEGDPLYSCASIHTLSADLQKGWRAIGPERTLMLLITLAQGKCIYRFNIRWATRPH